MALLGKESLLALLQVKVAPGQQFNKQIRRTVVPVEAKTRLLITVTLSGSSNNNKNLHINNSYDHLSVHPSIHPSIHLSIPLLLPST